VAWAAVAPYSTATQARYPAITQASVAASVAESLAQPGRPVVVTRSAAQQRVSRDPIQAEAPATKVAKSITTLSGMTDARRSQTAG
jgi:hypothetical protein